MQIRKNHKLALAAFPALTLGLVASAHADLPAGVAAGFTQIQTDAASVNTLAVPVVMFVLGLTIVIKLIKRFANKV